MAKQPNIFDREDFRMRRGLFIILFFGFMAQGCVGKIDITDDVSIYKPSAASSYAIVLNSRIDEISDFWKLGDYFYGYHYRGGQYEMFAVDLKCHQFYYGDAASRFVCKKGLPVDRWTNPAELFGTLITDRNRRAAFLQNCQK